MTSLQPRRAEQVFRGQAFSRPHFLGPSGCPASCAPLNKAAGSSKMLPVTNANSHFVVCPTINNGPPVCGFEATTASVPVASPLYSRHRNFFFTSISHPFSQHNLRVTLFIVGRGLRLPFPTLWAASLFLRRQGVDQDLARQSDSWQLQCACSV